MITQLPFDAHRSADELIDALVSGDYGPATEAGIKRLIADIDQSQPYYRRPYGWIEQASLDGGHLRQI